MYAIRCDKPPTKPVRKINRTWGSVSGRYAFRREKTIQFESTLERDFIVRMEFFLHVADVLEQPIEVPFRTTSGREEIYTPDFLVHFTLDDRVYPRFPHPLLIEVKPAKQWRTHYREWFPKWKAARAYAREQGWNFRVLDESRIRDVALANIQFLQRYQRIATDEEDNLAVLESVHAMGSTQMHYLVARHFLGRDRNEAMANLWHLVATRRLDCEIDGNLNDQTAVWGTNS